MEGRDQQWEAKYEQQRAMEEVEQHSRPWKG